MVGDGCSITGTGTSRTITVAVPDLSAYATTASLGSYALSATVNAALAGKIDTLTGAGCTISGTGASRTITVAATDLSAYVL